MIAALILGIWMVILVPDYISQGWMHAKLTFVVLLLGYHHWCIKIVKTFASDANTRTHIWYRIFNEAPVIALIAVVVLTIVKPF